MSFFLFSTTHRVFWPPFRPLCRSCFPPPETVLLASSVSNVTEIFLKRVDVMFFVHVLRVSHSVPVCGCETGVPSTLSRGSEGIEDVFTRDGGWFWAPLLRGVRPSQVGVLVDYRWCSHFFQWLQKMTRRSSLSVTECQIRWFYPPVSTLWWPVWFL